jgi:glucokinase
MPVWIAGDVGGTKTRVSLFERVGGRLVQHAERVYASAEHASLEEVLALHRRETGAPRAAAACFGVAGPVFEGRASATNLPWGPIEEASLARALGVPVRLVNDVEAAAYGMLALPDDALVELNPAASAPRRGHVAVIAAGTGLGEAFLLWDGERYHALPGEGGHADFAPRTDEELELLRWLRARLLGRVSWERVVSGPGLLELYHFARERSGAAEPDWLARRMAGEDPSAVVSEVALAAGDAACERALALFVSAYGAEAGNMAVRCLARGGVFVGGGIAPKILPALQGGAFLEAFCDKGRVEDLLRGLSVRVALDPRAPLLGASALAEELAAGRAG